MARFLKDLLLGVLLATLASFPALAANPPKNVSATDKMGSSSPYLGPIPLTAAGALVYLPTVSGGSVPQLIPYGSQVVISTCSVASWGFFFQAPTLAELSFDTGTGVITDSGTGAGVPGGTAPDGWANGFQIPTTGRAVALGRDFSPGVSVGARTGVCWNTTTLRNNGYPCQTNTHCSNFSAGFPTCHNDANYSASIDGGFFAIYTTGTCWVDFE